MWSLLNDIISLDEDERERKELQEAIQEFADYAFHHSMKREISSKAIAVALAVMVKENERKQRCPRCEGRTGR